MLGVDGSGRLCLKIAPPIKRTRVIPEPWRTNIPVRMWRRLTGRTNAPQPPKRELPPARWRRVGSLRRYILLALMIGQTLVAGWYMKGILPYQGWSFVSLDEIMAQSLWGVGGAGLALCFADEHPDPVRHPVLLGVGGLLDRADGLSRIAHRS